MLRAIVAPSRRAHGGGCAELELRLSWRERQECHGRGGCDQLALHNRLKIPLEEEGDSNKPGWDRMYHLEVLLDDYFTTARIPLALLNVAPKNPTGGRLQF